MGIRDNERNGRAQLIAVDEGSEPKELLKVLYIHLVAKPPLPHSISCVVYLASHPASGYGSRYHEVDRTGLAYCIHGEQEFSDGPHAPMDHLECLLKIPGSVFGISRKEPETLECHCQQTWQLTTCGLDPGHIMSY